MNITLKEIPIRDIVEKYMNDDDGVTGYNGRLNIRPKYQREFVYKEEQRNEVINTVRKNFPLNVMYWVESDTEDTYEVLDGQQRTISICEYVSGNFSINAKYFHSLQDDEIEQILNYKLMVYFCNGTDSEKLDWFKTINIAGEKLEPQELRNAVYTGPWLTEAKRHFSKKDCAAYNIANKYLTGTPIRQDYLETAIKWINNNKIEDYMADNQYNKNCNELWLYFNSVITWIKTLFPKYRKEMKGIDWGKLYNKYKDELFDANTIEKEIQTLIQDEEVNNKKGIYTFVITREPRYLSLRAFDD
ncbi:MAG: DUF262 domain-containing protein, partial [Campylobacterota bacterium]|nr:DUF262 domain-containing protein [Campylobacterota bacterium]